MVYLFVLFLIVMAVAVILYVPYNPARRECNDEFKSLMTEIRLSSPSDCCIMQRRVGAFYQKHRSMVGHDFIMYRVNKLYSQIKPPIAYVHKGVAY